jgi:chromate reductase
MDATSIFAFAGSLRKDSYNKALLRAAKELVPQNVTIEIFDLDTMPLYNQDIEYQMPDIIKLFKSKIKAAHALLIATPEYNFSIPGVLKNAIDWASRPYGENSFDGKPVAIMGASPGMIGSARAQYHLRQSCVYLNMYPVNQPEVIVSFAEKKINRNGVVEDDATRGYIKALMRNLIDLKERLVSK